MNPINEAAEREAFEHWMINDAKCIVGSSDPYPAGLERLYRSLWNSARATQRAEPAPSEAIDRRRCKPCAATRGGDHCWKCGAETFTPSPLCGDDPALPPIDRIRALAKEVGYAIGVHGSQQRDFDVIAAPWADNAIGSHALLEHIAKGLTTDNGPAHILSISRKPLGRYAATIQMDGWYKQLDISVCPAPSRPETAMQALADQAQELGLDYRKATPEPWQDRMTAHLATSKTARPKGASYFMQQEIEDWRKRAR